MNLPRFAKLFSVFMLLFCAWSQAYSQAGSYPSAPPVLQSNVERVATDIVQNKDADRLDSLFNDILFYVVADAVTIEKVSLRNLRVYQYLGETARTDKQTGSSAKSEGSTSAVEKPGFIQFLGFAIEHGAVQQQISSTSLTLSTSPYALIAMAKGDTGETYQNYEFFTRIGGSASFNISDNQASVLANVRRKDLTEWSIRLRLFGDRSTRSKKFQASWERDIKPKIQRRLNVITGAQSAIFVQKNGLNQLRKDLLVTLRDQIDKYVKAHTNDTDTAKQIGEVQEIILHALETSVFDKIKAGDISIAQSTRDEISNDFVPALFSAHADLEQARALLDKQLDALDSSPLLTFAYTNHRTSASPDSSEFKLLFEKKTWSPMAVVANAGVSFYHHPDRTKNQQSVRDFGAAISLEGKTNGPFSRETPDLSKLTFALNAHYQRMLENRRMPGKKADIAVVQFKLEFPIAMGVSFPISVTYANSTELVNEKDVRANFGITLDTDKLFALTRRLLKP